MANTFYTGLWMEFCICCCIKLHDRMEGFVCFPCIFAAGFTLFCNAITSIYLCHIMEFDQVMGIEFEES